MRFCAHYEVHNAVVPIQMEREVESAEGLGQTVWDTTNTAPADGSQRPTTSDQDLGKHDCTVSSPSTDHVHLRILSHSMHELIIYAINEHSTPPPQTSNEQKKR
ncbi:hypothetical protein FVER53590_25265 [Fusarium verticillioides]|nr:hypothetical protein FVER53590_25265 [Fusarium verticillioides]